MGSPTVAADWLKVAGVTYLNFSKVMVRFSQEETESLGQRHKRRQRLSEGKLQIFQAGRQDANHLNRGIFGR